MKVFSTRFQSKQNAKNYDAKINNTTEKVSMQVLGQFLTESEHQR